MPAQSSRPSCQPVMFRRSNVAVSPGPTVSDPGRSSGCGLRATTPIGTDSTVHSSVPATRTGT